MARPHINAMMELLASDFPFEKIQKLIPIFEQARIIDHVYESGTIMPRDELVWMKYIQPRPKYSQHAPDTFGYISFSRNTLRFVPEFCEIVGSWLQQKTGLDINYDAIHLVKTCGNIATHIDEGPRHTAINIGILNSSLAKTVYFEGSTILFENIQQGEAWVLNVKSPHAVYGPMIPRYIATYSMGDKFPDVISKLNFLNN